MIKYKQELLVTGGTGLVGNALKKLCPDAIFLNSKNYDLSKEDQVQAMFEKFTPKKVIHLAARVGGILDNMNHQADFFDQNILMNAYVLQYARKFQVERLIAFGSNCAYPDVVDNYPMQEEQLYAGPPAITNFSYAMTKRALLTQIQAYRTQHNCDFFAIIPCSLYGPNDKFSEKNSHFIPALIKKIHTAKLRGDKVIKLMGSGKPLRQYLYSEDLARIILLLLEKHKDGDFINVAPKENISIKEIAQIALRAIEAEDLEIEFDPMSLDGQFRKDLSADKLLGIIGDFKATSLEDGIRKTYQWYFKNAYAQN